MASATAWLVIPLHRQTNTERPAYSSIRIMSKNLPTNTGGYAPTPGSVYPRGRGVGMVDPAPGVVLVVELLQDHHFVAVVERLEHPGLPDARRLESSVVRADLVSQRGHVVDRRRSRRPRRPGPPGRRRLDNRTVRRSRRRTRPGCRRRRPRRTSRRTPVIAAVPQSAHGCARRSSPGPDRGHASRCRAARGVRRYRRGPICGV